MNNDSATPRFDLLIRPNIPWLPIVRENMNIKLEFVNNGDIEYPDNLNLSYEIESEKINIGEKGTSAKSYEDIYAYKDDLKVLKKKEDSVTYGIQYTPLISGKYKLTVKLPDRSVDNSKEEDVIRFWDVYNQKYVGDWFTLFEVYSWPWIISMVASILFIIGTLITLYKTFYG